jgi:hypothetical protein
MSTTPVVTAPSGFWATLKQLLPAIEMAGNVALLASGVGAGVEPLVSGLESATLPLIQSIGTQQTASTELVTFYGTVIGVLGTLKTIPGLPTATLTEINGYILAAEAGTAQYVQAQSGFVPANYSPVTPIT